MKRVEAKAEWRKWAKSLPPATEQESAAVVAHVTRFVAQKGWRTVLTFLAMPGEVDLTTVDGPLELAVTRTPARGDLTLHRLTGHLETHPLGYRQPREDAPLIEGSSIEAVMVPGVLFGLNGARLGHGKGYYDRLISRFDHRPFLLGITLERRLVEGLPMMSTDVFMDAIATELGVSPASPSSQ